MGAQLARGERVVPDRTFFHTRALLRVAIASRRKRLDPKEFEAAYRAGDYARCHELVDDNPSPDAKVMRARVDCRERNYGDAIAILSPSFKNASAEAKIWRDMLLGVALAGSRDYDAGDRLIQRALEALTPGSRLYFEAMHFRGLVAWMRHDNREAERCAREQLTSDDPTTRGRGHSLLSWVAIRRGDALLQVEELVKSLDELESAKVVDQGLRAVSTLTLAVLCREIPLDEVAERVRRVYEELPWTDSLRLEQFFVIRHLAHLDAMHGNDFSAFAKFKQSASLAPNDYWRLFCLVDRTYLAKHTGEAVFAAEQLEEAHKLAQQLSWTEVTGEERAVLQIMAELFSHHDIARANEYLTLFRSITGNVLPILTYGSDARVRAFTAYTQGVLWLRLGEIEQGKTVIAEAWSTFDAYSYGWRAANCAITLYEVTREPIWLERAIAQIAPWPQSWLARRITSAAQGRIELSMGTPGKSRQLPAANGEHGENRQIRELDASMALLLKSGRIAEQADLLLGVVRDLDINDGNAAALRAWTTAHLARLARDLYLPDALGEIERQLASPTWFDRYADERSRAHKDLAIARALAGDYSVAFRHLKRAYESAISPVTAALALWNEAFLARCIGEVQWARVAIEEAERRVADIDWNTVSIDDRLLLLYFAEFFSVGNVGKASHYLTKYRELGRAVSTGDRRVKAIAAYSIGVTQLALDNRQAGLNELRQARRIFESYGYDFCAAEAGLAEYRVTRAPELLKQIQTLLRNYPQSWAAKEIASDLQLPQRQREVLALVCEGLSNGEISTRQGISEHTVRNQLKTIFRAFGVRSRSALVAEAVRRGFFEKSS